MCSKELSKNIKFFTEKKQYIYTAFFIYRLMEIIFLLTGIIVGSLAAWFIAKSKFNTTSSGVPLEEFNKLDKEKERVQTQLSLISEDKEKITKELSEEREKLQLANNR